MEAATFMLGQCERLRARISAQQCKTNRSRGTFACIGCPGLTGIAETVYQPPAELPAEPIAPLVHQENLPVPRVRKQEIEEESTMTTEIKKCAVCKREGLKIKGSKCPRCYYRISKGLDPITGELPQTPVIRSTPTDEDKAAVILKPMKSVPAVPAAPPVPPAPAPATPAEVAASVPAAAAPSIEGPFQVDILAALDDAWQNKRQRFLEDLMAQESPAERLRIGFRMLANVQATGY